MLLEIRDVHQSFRSGFWLKRAHVLHGVSLSSPEGAVVGFLGPNGAGKTTLIHLITGIRTPVSGTLRLGGFDTQSLEARAMIGYLPERPYFHEHLTGEGLLRFFGKLSAMSSRDIEDRIPVVLEQVGMSHARELELRKYSKGMLQRIGIAQAILHRPRFLVLDEPMSGLDPVGRKEIRELILQLATEGHTIFFSSHVIPDVEAICDQVVMIKKGRIVGDGPIEQLVGKETTRVEIACLGADEKKLQSLPGVLSTRTLPGEVRLVAESAAFVTPLLAQLIGLGAEVVSVSPIRPSLESFFHD